MDKEFKKIMSKAEELKQTSHSLAKQLHESVKKLEQNGQPLSLDLLDNAQHFQKNFEALKEEVASFEEHIAFSPRVSALKIFSLKAMSVSLKEIYEQGLPQYNSSRKKKKITDTISLLRSIRHRKVDNRASMEVFQNELDRVGKLIDSVDLKNPNEELILLERGEHILNCLENFLLNQTNLSDAEWESLYEKTKNVFGISFTRDLVSGDIYAETPPEPIAVIEKEFENLDEDDGEEEELEPETDLVDLLVGQIDEEKPLSSEDTERQAEGSFEDAQEDSLSEDDPFLTEEVEEKTNESVMADSPEGDLITNDVSLKHGEPGSEKLLFQEENTDGLEGSGEEAHVGPHEERELMEECDLPVVSQKSDQPAQIAPSFYESSPHSSAPAILDSLFDADTPDEAAFSRLSINLLLDDRGSLAYNVQKLLEDIIGRPSTYLPSALLRDLLLAQNALSSAGELAQRLKMDFMEIDFKKFVSLDDEWLDTLHLLVASSTLRPTLIVPSTGAGAVLNSIRFSSISVKSFLAILRAALEFGNYSRPLEPNWLKGRSAWEQRVKDVVNGANLWHEKASASSMNFRPATAVWRLLMTSKTEEEGIRSIENMIAPIRSNDVAKLGETRELLEFFSNQINCEQTIDLALKNVLRKQRSSKIKTIEAGARVKLLRNIREACEIADNWVSLQETAKSLDASFLKKHAEDFKKTFEKHFDEARNELIELKRKHEGSSLEAGFHCAIAVLDDIANMFDPSKPLPTMEPQLETLLNFGLLKTGLILDENMNIVDGDPIRTLKKIRKFLSSEEPSWPEVISDKIEKKDLTGLRNISNYLRKNEPQVVDIDRLDRELQEKEREWKENSLFSIERTQSEIEDALNSGILKEAERGAMLGKTEELKIALETVKEKPFDFGQAASTLDKIGEELALKKKQAAEECRAHMEKEGIGESHPFFDRIIELLTKNDFITAESYVQMSSEGKDLPQSTRNVFSEFFPKKAQEIEDYLIDSVKGNRPPFKNTLLELIKKQSKVCGVDMKYVPGKHAQQASDMMKAWWDSGRNKKITEEQARTILRGIGFNVQKVNVYVEHERWWINLEAETLADRNLCPVACYGSSARGRYRILCDWSRPSEEKILSSVPSPGMLEAPVLVFHFGCFTYARRCALASRSLEEKKTFLLIDDTLMIFLCGERNERLNPMFRCTLPFTYIQPFVTTASFLPPEMFYGRQEELEEIISPVGACLVYGGRQLGKTVLLRDAERRFDNGKNKIAIWIDLEGEGVGSRLSVEFIWEVLARKFKERGIFPSEFHISQITAERFSEMTKTWLNKDSQRSILLLLDEADAFFERDFCNEDDRNFHNGHVREFMATRTIKVLMDETERRFKVVFAGLHNVGRNTRKSNNPIAHLGRPVCVGPLIERQEHLQARALVREPFQVAGYEISEDLITRILSQTNYYPSLIQIYCHNLLMDLTSRQQKKNNKRFSSFAVPPYEIVKKNLDDAYTDRDLRNTIRGKFLLTLQLDERYRIIAYALAFNVLLQDDSGLVDGFPEQIIFDLAKDAWPEGFVGFSTQEEFRVILDEMVGLGVLSQLEGGRYTFRGRNVPLLLGTEEEIMQILSSPRETLPEYNPATYCPPVRGTDMRSPLTVLQEEVLLKRSNGIVVVAGCNGSGLNNLRPFLEQRLETEFFHPMESLELVKAKSDYRALVSKDISKGLHIVFFDSETTPWTRKWLQSFKAELEKSKPNSGKVFRILFSANPSTLWGAMSEEGERIIEECDDILALTKWHERTLKNWLQEREHVPPAALEKKSVESILEITGGWLTMLRLVGKGASVNNGKVEDFLRDVRTNADSPDFVKASLREDFQLLENNERQVVLKSIKDLEPLTHEDLNHLFKDDLPSPQTISKTIRWADTLQFIRDDEEGRLLIDPVVGRFLEIAGKQDGEEV